MAKESFKDFTKYRHNFNAASFLIFKEPKVFPHFTIFGKYHFFYVGHWGGILHVLGEILLLILLLLPPPLAIESSLSGTEHTQGLCQCSWALLSARTGGSNPPETTLGTGAEPAPCFLTNPNSGFTPERRKSDFIR